MIILSLRYIIDIQKIKELILFVIHFTLKKTNLGLNQNNSGEIMMSNKNE